MDKRKKQIVIKIRYCLKKFINRRKKKAEETEAWSQYIFRKKHIMSN